MHVLYYESKKYRLGVGAIEGALTSHRMSHTHTHTHHSQSATLIYENRFIQSGDPHLLSSFSARLSL